VSAKYASAIMSSLEKPLPRKSIILAIVLIAFFSRLFFCLLVVVLQTPPRGDEADYHALALNIAAGEGYVLANGQVTARRPPSYPFFLSVWYLAAAGDPAVGRIVQVLLGTLIVWMVYVLAASLFDRRTAEAASLLAALNPFLVFASSYLLTENLYICILLVLLIFLARAEGSPNRPGMRAVVSGILIGVLSLTRPGGFLFAGFVVAWIVMQRGQTAWRKAACLLLFAGAVLFTLSPWLARNHRVFDRWIPFTTHGGITFYQGNNEAVLEYPQYHGGVAPFYMLPEWREISGLDEATRDTEARKLGVEFLLANKGRVPELVARKFLRFWRLRSDAGMSGIKSGWWWNKDGFWGKLAAGFDLGFIYAIIVIPAFLVGLVTSWKRRRDLLLLYGVVVVHNLIALVFFGSLRARLPVEPVIALFAAVGIGSVWRRLRGSRAENDRLRGET